MLGHEEHTVIPVVLLYGKKAIWYGNGLANKGLELEFSSTA